MKKLLLFFAMILLPMVANADAVEINGIYYNLISKAKVAEVTQNPNKYTGNVVIPELVTYDGTDYSVTSIGEYAFMACSGLTSVTIPNSVTSIGDRAFWSCSGLTSVTIGNSVASIGGAAFVFCSALTSVHISDVAAWCNIKFARDTAYGMAANPLSYADHLFLNGEEIKDLVIPNSVTSIGDYAFWYCEGLTSVTIGNSVTSIGECAFESCSGLTSITIPNSVTSIGKNAFDSCFGLTSITIPNSVTSIGDKAFRVCYGLTSVIIGNSVTSIGDDAFCKCSGLTSVTIPNSVTSIGYGAFQYCKGLTSVTIPNSVTSIGDGAFQYCSGLTSVTIGNSVTSIGECVFSDCSNLTSVTIGNGIKTIRTEAFASCSELTDVYCYAVKVPSTNTDVFKNFYIECATLHVPAESVDAYKAMEPWKNFKSIVATDGETPSTKKCDNPTISYVNGQLKMSCATEGADYVTDITDADIKKYYDATITLTATYNISVYATKSGYENSETVTATLCWIDVEPKTEGITNNVANVRALPLLIQNNGSTLTVSGADDGTPITVYSINGIEAGSAISQNGAATIPTTLQSGSATIVKVGNKSIKVVIK